MSLTIYFLRHGETTASQTGGYCGTLDPELTPEGMRWYELATLHPGRTDAELSAAIEQHLKSTIYLQLDPKTALSRLNCPLFLIHGAYDDLIPPRESVAMLIPASPRTVPRIPTIPGRSSLEHKSISPPG